MESDRISKYLLEFRLANVCSVNCTISCFGLDVTLPKQFKGRFSSDGNPHKLLQWMCISCLGFEKTRQLTALGYNKRELQDSLSLTLPRSHNGKLPADSLSLVNEPGTVDENDLGSNKLLSSSLQDLSLAGKLALVYPPECIGREVECW